MARYKQLAKTTHDDKLNEQILDAQLLDLQPLIGESLFNKILAAPQEFDDLLEGGIYEHEGISYTNYGLKMVLCYYAYARYMMFSSAVDTPFSVVEKLSDNSRPVEPLAKKTIYNLNRETAQQVWGNVKNYLIRTLQPDYIGCPAKHTTGFRLKKIS
ncbi:DUF6712 family protein [Flavobacterium psychrotrophum]|uniref:DUF6712 family protein n=1 Tax=Flavobacterium psychrotrophum TaxID=2294119 RepID=UPI000E315FC1|nr:hypothetical protein [Flavobacterium psychrotrophum]